MPHFKETSTNLVLTYITNFIEGKILQLSQNHRKNPEIFHYYIEIVRYWNLLNFIVKKTLRSLNNFQISDSNEMAKYLYGAFRVIWESAQNQSVLNELKLSISFLNKVRTFSLKKALYGKSKVEKLSLEGAIPTFFIKHLLPVVSFEFLKKNIHFMNEINKIHNITLRLNDLSQSIVNTDLRNTVIRDLTKSGIILKQDTEIAELFRSPMANKSRILKSKWYKSGNLIFQDKASAAVVKALSPKPNELIYDMCAAPGIKTSLIAQITKNKSRIIANEFLTSRTIQSKMLLNNLKVFNTYLINSDGIKFPCRYTNYFDKILLDAPCTGSGNLQSNPELKWRQNEKFLHQNITIQEKLLQSAFNLLKPNGILVYSTCSLYPEEGEQQIIKILDKVETMKLPKWLSPSYEIEGKIIPGTGRLFPSTHQTQGFFIGKFKKKE